MKQNSLSEQFLEENRSGDDPFTWLIVYDFIDFKPNPNFWKNLDKMIRISGLRKFQYSVLITEKTFYMVPQHPVNR